MSESIINIQSCTICLGEIISECITDCSHIFCKECLDKWFDRGNSSCPMCRKSIQYLNNNNIDYRVIVRNPNIATNINTNTNTISRSSVESLIRHYYNMRYIIFIMFVLMIMGYNYYLKLDRECTNLRTSYLNSIQNITDLNNELINCYSSYGKAIIVNIWNQNDLRKCLIPLFSYLQCFPE